ncbi:MAG: DUF2203 domain-containing protein [Gemmatimonadetes bacterium]|nr:DUF2203 domain-containing protein [Gemmatimonadota bacterium]
MAIKYFTLDGANKALPLVNRIVADILHDFEIWRDRIRRYELLSSQATAESGESPDQVALREQVDEVAHRINGYMDELAQIGCLFKGFDEGLVDFYSKRDDRDVFLCWKYGESAVEHWHELEGGFTGRQPVEAPVAGDA